MTPEIIKIAKILRDYHHMHHIIQPSDIIMVLWSNDLRVVDRAVELLKAWYSDRVLFSGGLGRLTDTDVLFQWMTEADLFAKIAIEKGIDKDKILIENKSTNTWENIQLSYAILQKYDIKSIILIQKPYMERRTFATFSQQRPDKTTSFIVTSPQLLFEEYPTERLSYELLINMMVWDLQRIIEYPALWFQIYQEVPEKVMNAYYRLIDMWFTEKMIS